MPTTMTVTGNLQDLTGTNNAGYVLFDLINFGDYIPRIIGTSNIVNRKIIVAADASGAISTQLWGNDNINPAGTLYYVCVLDNTKVPIQCNTYDITGSAFDLNSANPSPLPPLPTTQTSQLISVTSPSGFSSFTQAHSLGQVPTDVLITATSGGFIWLRSPKYDATTIYLSASDVGVTADIYLWAS